MINLQDLLIKILGTEDFEMILAGLIFAMVGAILSILIDSSKHKIENRGKGLFRAFVIIRYNIRRLLIAVLTIIVFMRFSDHLIGAKLTVWVGFVIGFISEKLSEYLKKLKDKLFNAKTGKIQQEVIEKHEEEQKSCETNTKN
tara:strand:+ start:20837 stop:21265 length:429 start_codon:yes stop_codon:yes gene_type:complete